MITNESPKLNRPFLNWLSRAWKYLSQPHPSIEKVGQKRRAQLAAIISLILISLFMVAMLFRPSSYNGLLALLIISIVSYGFSRTRYHWMGSYAFSYGITSLAYISLFLGTASSFEAAITTYAYT